MVHNAQNKQIFGNEYNYDSKEIIFKAAGNFKKIFRKHCSHKIFLQKVPEENASTGTMRKYKQS